MHGAAGARPREKTPGDAYLAIIGSSRSCIAVLHAANSRANRKRAHALGPEAQHSRATFFPLLSAEPTALHSAFSDLSLFVGHGRLRSDYMRFVVVFITCMAQQPCDVIYPAPYEDFSTRADCLQLADLFDIPAFQRPYRKITCMDAPAGAGTIWSNRAAGMRSSNR